MVREIHRRFSESGDRRERSSFEVAERGVRRGSSCGRRCRYVARVRLATDLGSGRRRERWSLSIFPHSDRLETRTAARRDKAKAENVFQ